LFRFADKWDYLMMTLGTLGGLGLGAATPVFILFWGNFTDVFSSGPDVIVDEARKQLLNFVYLGIGTLFLGWTMIFCWFVSGERQASTCRKAYFACLLRQEIGWFDCVNQSSLSSNFSADTLTYQGAIGEKMATMIQAIGTGIGGFAVAFSQGWLMTLVCLGGIPVLILSGAIYMRSMGMKAK
jgi:ATP-binding cassette, subfamily B (MDR/TAP), member 1